MDGIYWPGVAQSAKIMSAHEIENKTGYFKRSFFTRFKGITVSF